MMDYRAEESVEQTFRGLNWYHGAVNRDLAEKMLIVSGSPGDYLLRPSSSDSRKFAVTVRTDKTVKHFPVKIEGDSEILFGLVKFKTSNEFSNHFNKQPLLVGESGTVVVLKSPFLVTDKTNTVYEVARIHGEMNNQSLLTSSSGSLKCCTNSEHGGLKSGFLTKQGGFLKNWRYRYCVLDGLELKYYQKEGDMVPRGLVDIRDCSECDKDSEQRASRDRENVFKIVTPWRTFLFECSTVSEMESWIIAIRDKLKICKQQKEAVF